MIVIVGLNHETAPVAVREAMAFTKDGLAAALAQVRKDAGLDEVMILSTCNRVEIYGHSEKAALGAVAEFLARHHGRAPEDVEKHLYRLEGEPAVRHAFRVAASLDSMVLGESQILGQVKEAYQAAEEAKSLGAVLNGLRTRSISAAKRARTETAIGRNAVSVSHVAVELASKIFGDLHGHAVLLVGAGK
jgi:glutamyl-tRNA reductase